MTSANLDTDTLILAWVSKAFRNVHGRLPDSCRLDMQRSWDSQSLHLLVPPDATSGT